MRKFVLLFAFFLKNFACSTLSIPDQSLQRNPLEFETASAALGRIDSNREPQAVDKVYNDDEERMSARVVAEESAPMLGSLRSKLMKEQVPEAIKSISGTKKGLTSYFKWLGQWFLDKWTPTPEEVNLYIELQLLLQEPEPWREEYKRIMAYGHTPFFWKHMIDYRSNQWLTQLPLYKPAEKRAELERLHWFTFDYLIFCDPQQHPLSFVSSLKRMGPSTPAQLQIVADAVAKAEEIIETSHSIDELFRMDISPVIYATALTKTGPIKATLEGHDVFHMSDVSSVKNVENDFHYGEDQEVVNVEQLEALKRYRALYREELLGLQEEIRSALAALPKTSNDMNPQGFQWL